MKTIIYLKGKLGVKTKENVFPSFNNDDQTVILVNFSDDIVGAYELDSVKKIVVEL